MGWEHYQTVNTSKESPRFGVRLLILHFKFQFSKFIKCWTFHIFLNLTCPLKKKISISQKKKQKSPKNLHKTDRQRVVKWNKQRDLRCLKRDRDIGRKAVLSDVKTVFTFTPAIMNGVKISIFRDFSSKCQFSDPFLTLKNFFPVTISWLEATLLANSFNQKPGLRFNLHIKKNINTFWMDNVVVFHKPY